MKRIGHRKCLLLLSVRVKSFVNATGCLFVRQENKRPVFCQPPMGWIVSIGRVEKELRPLQILCQNMIRTWYTWFAHRLVQLTCSNRSTYLNNLDHSIDDVWIFVITQSLLTYHGILNILSNFVIHEKRSLTVNLFSVLFVSRTWPEINGVLNAVHGNFSFQLQRVTQKAPLAPLLDYSHPASLIDFPIYFSNTLPYVKTILKNNMMIPQGMGFRLKSRQCAGLRFSDPAALGPSDVVLFLIEKRTISNETTEMNHRNWCLTDWLIDWLRLN